jgi:hypothetical protein
MSTMLGIIPAKELLISLMLGGIPAKNKELLMSLCWELFMLYIS